MRGHCLQEADEAHRGREILFRFEIYSVQGFLHMGISRTWLSRCRSYFTIVRIRVAALLFGDPYHVVFYYGLFGDCVERVSADPC